METLHADEVALADGIAIAAPMAANSDLAELLFSARFACPVCDYSLPELPYPMIVKPRNESVSFGLKVVPDEEKLRAAAQVIFDEYQQPVLVEQYIEGREINVGLLGNNPPEAFPPVQLDFGEGPAVYSYEDKTGRSGRSIGHVCPAPIGDELTRRAQEIAIGSFQALGLNDCARVDMRLDGDGNLYILEINSLPSLGEHGSYLIGAAHVGLDCLHGANKQGADHHQCDDCHQKISYLHGFPLYPIPSIDHRFSISRRVGIEMV